MNIVWYTLLRPEAVLYRKLFSNNCWRALTKQNKNQFLTIYMIIDIKLHNASFLLKWLVVIGLFEYIDGRFDVICGRISIILWVIKKISSVG